MTAHSRSPAVSKCCAGLLMTWCLQNGHPLNGSSSNCTGASTPKRSGPMAPALTATSSSIDVSRRMCRQCDAQEQYSRCMSGECNWQTAWQLRCMLATTMQQSHRCVWRLHLSSAIALDLRPDKPVLIVCAVHGNDAPLCIRTACCPAAAHAEERALDQRRMMLTRRVAAPVGSESENEALPARKLKRQPAEAVAASTGSWMPEPQARPPGALVTRGAFAADRFRGSFTGTAWDG